MSRIPIIDIEPTFLGDPQAKLAVASAIDAACRDLGFLLIRGPQDSGGGRARHVRRVQQLFCPARAGESTVALGVASELNGYIAMGAETLDATRSKKDGAPSKLVDLKESFGMGPPLPADPPPYYTSARGQRYFQPTPWPSALPAMAAHWRQYWNAMEQLAKT